MGVNIKQQSDFSFLEEGNNMEEKLQVIIILILYCFHLLAKKGKIRSVRNSHMNKSLQT